ncbi:MAG: ribulose-phosphate 3-epimerase [Oliverpabstia sp.]
MYTLSPSVYAANYMILQNQVDSLKESGVNCLHVDVMDGHFVPNMAFGPDFVQNLRENTDLKLDLHLMIDRPERMLKDFADAGADSIIVHYEACPDLEAALEEIHSYGINAGVALKPETGLEVLSNKIWEKIDVLQIMTVQPGMKNQHFIDAMVDKIKTAHEHIEKINRTIQIGVDGDITLERLKQTVDAGAGVIVVGKAIFRGNLNENVKAYVNA